MEYLQYGKEIFFPTPVFVSFKPYYKWNTFNTMLGLAGAVMIGCVLNLIINGIPSILYN